MLLNARLVFESQRKRGWSSFPFRSDSLCRKDKAPVCVSAGVHGKMCMHVGVWVYPLPASCRHLFRGNSVIVISGRLSELLCAMLQFFCAPVVQSYAHSHGHKWTKQSLYFFSCSHTTCAFCMLIVVDLVVSAGITYWQDSLVSKTKMSVER